MTDDDDDAELQAALSLSISQSAAKDTTTTTAPSDKESDAMDEDSAAAAVSTEPEMVLPQVDESLLKEVVDMGFDEVRVRKALMSGCSNSEAVVNWVLEHGEEPDIDAPIPLVAKSSAGSGSGGYVRSWKCAETGKLFRTMDEVQMYAERTGRSNFEESVDEKKPLTKEEIAAKMEALKEKIAARRAERGEVCSRLLLLLQV
jgi:hypothetical protein